jgi:hypothetical protein
MVRITDGGGGGGNDDGGEGAGRGWELVSVMPTRVWMD